MSYGRKLSDQLRDIARIGIVNYKSETQTLKEAARQLDEQKKTIDDQQRRIEDLEERIAIMAADMDQTQMDAINEIRN